ncbi:MAG: hypothetical protein RL723_708 [Actinomycetota bacterium]|jgi:hypothetical protein
MAIAFKVQEDFESSLAQLFSVISDVDSWVVFERPRLISAKNGQVRLAFDDQSRALISFELLDGIVRAHIVHELLKEESAVKAKQLYWQEVLGGLHRRLDRP